MSYTFTIPDLSVITNFFASIPSEVYWIYGFVAGIITCIITSIVADEKDGLYGWQIFLIGLSWPITIPLFITWGIFTFLFTKIEKDKK